MKNFFLGALTAVMLFGFGNFVQASDVDYENLCGCSGYYCATDDNGKYCYNNGEYCGRYGCGEEYRGR